MTAEFTLDEKKLFLKFFTGSDRAPIGGLGALRIVVQRDGPDGPKLPTSHTCFNTLLLPDYASRAKMADRLRLAIDGGKAIELQDCPYGDAGYRYLYERYEDPGRFYVVRRSGLDDFGYALVMKRTGRLFAVHGVPVWASDKTRFLTVACSLQPSRGALSIFAPSGDGLTTEADIALPCATESCSARWDFESWISIACTPRDDTSRKGREFVLMRGKDGKWSVLPR